MYTTLLAGFVASILSESGDLSARCPFPNLVQKMLKWPDQEVLNGPNRLHPAKEGRFPPLQNSQHWIQRILDPNWLPPSTVKDEMVFVKQEYGPLSASHVRWEKNGYKIQVTQTRGIIAIKLEPAFSPAVPTTQKDLEAYARDLCMKLFTDTFMTTFRKRPMDDPLRIEGVRAKIAEYSFECALKRSVGDGLVAAAWNPQLVPPDDKAPSQPASQMWYCYIGWYTNGKTVAFWTFKTAGDSWVCPPACTADPIGRNWF